MLRLGRLCPTLVDVSRETIAGSPTRRGVRYERMAAGQYVITVLRVGRSVVVRLPNRQLRLSVCQRLWGLQGTPSSPGDSFRRAAPGDYRGRSIACS